MMSNREQTKIAKLVEAERVNQDMTLRMIKHIRETKFSVGDILLKRVIDNNERDNDVKVDTEYYDHSTVPHRYKVVYIDPDNIPWAQSLSLAGEIEDPPFVPFDLCGLHDGDEYDSGSCSYYEVDPLCVDATIMGQSFDVANFLREQKSMLEDIEKRNKVKAITPKNLKEANAFFLSLKKGDTFYVQTNYSYTAQAEEFRFDGLRRLTISKIKQCSRAWYGLYNIKDNKKLKNDSIICEIKINGHHYGNYAANYLNQNLYKEKPLTGSDK